MKKLLLVLLLVSLSVSCSKDEDENLDTSTFTGLYNDTVWVYDGTISDFMDFKEVAYFKNSKFFHGTIDYIDTAPDCSKYIEEYYESENWGGTDIIVYEVNTPENLIVSFYTADNIEGGYEVIKFTVENEKLISKTGEGFGEFDIINVEWDEIYVKFKNLSSDYSWSDFLAFDCE
jgi:hypothetical protein